MKTVLVGGGSGWIGNAIGIVLKSKGYEVLNISRTQRDGVITWQSLKEHGFPEGVAGVIQLSGASMVQRRWTEDRKKELYQSRVDVTRELVDSISSPKCKDPPRVFICVSAVGLYPGSESGVFDEDTTLPDPDHFAGKLCRDWEQASASLSGATRRVIIRAGDVLGPGGGDLPYMAFHFRLGVGGPMGGGTQFFSWISLLDLCRLFVFALENEHVHGILNGVSPCAVTNAEFAHALGRALWRPSIVRAPAVLVRLVLGEMAQMILEGARIVPSRTLACGFAFQHADLAAALQYALTSQDSSMA